MNVDKWLRENAVSLAGKRIALTGATGGLGRELCLYLANLGAKLILLDRNPVKAAKLDAFLRKQCPTVSIERVFVDLSDMDGVRSACERLIPLHPDILIHNAGAYAIPRGLSNAGYDRVFQINFVSPYYITRRLLPHMPAGGLVVAVGSIAHRYSRSDETDVDFCARRQCNLVYGNAKRYLMAALWELFAGERRVGLAVVHPGITCTEITAHYPKWLYAIIRRPMQWIFMPPRKAALSLLAGLFWPCKPGEWIGPWFFDVWGKPRRARVNSIPAEERMAIAARADAIWQHLQN